MRNSDIVFITITILLGIIVLYSYYDQLGDKGKSIYDNKYWLGIDKNIINFILPFMFLALIGFLTFFIGYLINPPEIGLLSYVNGWVTVILMAIFLGASIGWSFSVNKAIKKNASFASIFMTSFFLILASIAVILMLGGSFEAENIVLIVGMLFLNIQVVFNDAIGWNAIFLLQKTKKN